MRECENFLKILVYAHGSEGVEGGIGKGQDAIVQTHTITLYHLDSHGILVEYLT